MDNEKSLLRNDLENQNTPEEIKKFVEDAELLGHEDIAELGRQKLAEIESKSNEISKTSESQISQVNELGGSNEELENRTSEVDKKIEEVKEDTQNKIKDVESQNIEKEKTFDEIEKEYGEISETSLLNINNKLTELENKINGFGEPNNEFFKLRESIELINSTLDQRHYNFNSENLDFLKENPIFTDAFNLHSKQFEFFEIAKKNNRTEEFEKLSKITSNKIIEIHFKTNEILKKWLEKRKEIDKDFRQQMGY